MRTGKILWGLILLIAGVVLLLNTLGIATFSLLDLLMWWPLLLIYWGMAAFTKTPNARLAVFVLFLVLAAGLITASSYYNWIDYGHREVASQNLEEGLSSDVVTATFTLQSGAGDFTVTNTTGDQLVTASAETSFGEYKLETNQSGSHADVLLTMDSEGTFWRGMHAHMMHDVTARLNVVPIWDIVVDSGASDVNLNLQHLIVQNVTVKSGASSVDVVMGDLAEHATVTVKTGASSVNVRIPESVGGKITADSGLSSHDFTGFVQQSDNSYQTTGYAEATKKIDINLSAGVSSLTVTRE